jgi:hypothetical protein
MNPIEKIALQDKLREMYPDIENNIIFKIITGIDKLGFLKDKGLVEGEVVSTYTDADNLPKVVTIFTPMWQGKVTLTKTEGYFSYKDDMGNVRLYDKTERGLAKKLKRYTR